MGNFAERMRELFANKIFMATAGFVPNPKESLEVLLEHVYQKALVPAHYILTDQPQFALSSLSLEGDPGFGDVFDDGMDWRPKAVLKVVRQQQLLFEYWLSFEGDNESCEASLWSKVEFFRQPVTLNDLGPDLFNLEVDHTLEQNRPDKTVLDPDAVNDVGEEFCYLKTLDMAESVSLIQEELYSLFEKLL